MTYYLLDDNDEILTAGADNLVWLVEGTISPTTYNNGQTFYSPTVNIVAILAHLRLIHHKD